MPLTKPLRVPHRCGQAGSAQKDTGIPILCPGSLRGLCFERGGRGGGGSILAGRHQTSVSECSLLRLGPQIESEIGVCLLLFNCFFTQRFVKLRFKVLNGRSDNESSQRRIQRFHSGVCKRPYMCALPCVSFGFRLLSVPIYKNV